MSSTVVVIGPTGRLGRRPVPLLARRGVTVHAANWSPVAARGGTESVRFDWSDESTYETARKSVDAMYLEGHVSPIKLVAGATVGRGRINSDDVRTVTGRNPITFADFTAAAIGV